MDLQGDVKAAEKAIAAGADALVADVVDTVRKHPQYANMVNGLVDKTIEALMAAI